MEKRRKKQNNAGFSLVEMIVVVLIMGVLSATVVVGFSFIRSMDASSAGEALLSALNRTKLQTTASASGETIQLKITQEGNQYYGTILKEKEEEDGSTSVTVVDKMEIGGTGISITAEEADGDRTSIDTSTPCIITYQKSNGAFASSCEYIKLEVTGSKTKTVRLVKETGRSYME